MGRPALRLGDLGSGHDCHFPTTPAIEGSPNVFINSRPAVREGDAYMPHGCPSCKQPLHPRKLLQGSTSVFINDKPAGRLGDPIDCGGAAISGSPNVFIGDPCMPTVRTAFCYTCECGEQINSDDA